MAIFYPTLEEIKNMTVPPTPGEMELLEYFSNNSDIYDDSWEVYFQPAINGRTPDIVLLRENHGVYIIEVKDWNLEAYTFIDDKFCVKGDMTAPNQYIILEEQPVDQALTYRNVLYKLETRHLSEDSIKDKRYHAIVNTCVYFTNADKEQRKNFFENHRHYEISHSWGIPVYKTYTHILGKGDLSDNTFESVITHGYMGKKKSILFRQDLYDELRNVLRPSKERIEQHQLTPIRLTKSQQRAVGDGTFKSRKIRGVAGSGKTTVLAATAVEFIKRNMGAKVLILTYNITIRRYIEDKLKRLAPWMSRRVIASQITVMHYHSFAKRQNGYSAKAYGLVLLDEFQDWEPIWVEKLLSFFSSHYYEKVIDEKEKIVYKRKTGVRKKEDLPPIYYFADERQNIYNREVDEEKKPIVTTVPGKWYNLKTSQRLNGNISSFARQFAERYLEKKYGDSSLETENTELFGGVKYLKLEDLSDDNFQKLYHFLTVEEKQNPNDICCIFNTIELGRKVHSGLPKEIKATITFETQKEYEEVCAKYPNKKHFPKAGNPIEDVLVEIRKGKKHNFRMNEGKIKLTTIHSFKGWEIENVVVILNGDNINNLQDKHCSVHELFYVAITRARTNLYILEVGESQYSDFLQEMIAKGDMTAVEV